MSAPSSQDLFSQEPEIQTQESEIRSGLRSSEIDSQLSYSELSSMEPNSTQQVGVEHRSTDLTDIPKNVIYGTDVNIGAVMEKFKKFLNEFKLDQLEENFVSNIGFDPEIPYYIQKMRDMAEIDKNNIDIDCCHLKNYSINLYENLLKFPKEVIPAMDIVAKNVFQTTFKNINKIETRPFNCGDARNLRNLRPEDLDQIVTVSGLIYRLTDVIPEVIECSFQCTNCSFVLKSTCENQTTIQPETCNNCHANYTMNIIHNLSEYIDKQIVKLQECPDEMPAGQTPQNITMYCYQQLVDSVQPGDRVVVTGIFRSAAQRVNPRQREVKAVLNTYIDVLHIKKTTAGLNVSDNVKLSTERIQEIINLSTKPDIYERLSSAIAPSVYEHEDIKKGLLLQLFGGVQSDENRGNIHVLLCGDPGTSKSQLLQYVHNISPRSQYSSGKGTSGAGLTAYITHDFETKHAVLQAGSLVLADNGICCIDEFDKMPDSTRSALHEVMEQQSLSIAKGGVICQLNARTSVLAASNPVDSKWDIKKNIIENIKLPPTLLSRFDLIFLMLNPQNEKYDARLARHLISLYQSAQDSEPNEGVLDLDFIRDYISYARQNFNPVFSEETVEYLCKEYVEMRKVGRESRGQVGAYPRHLESLKRLSEAYARMRLSNTVELSDCKEARRLQKEALKQSAVDPLTGLIDVNILATGITGGMRRRREELSSIIWELLIERGVMTHQYQQVLEELQIKTDRMVTRELFEDALNLLKIDNKVDYAGKIIKCRL